MTQQRLTIRSRLAGWARSLPRPQRLVVDRPAQLEIIPVAPHDTANRKRFVRFPWQIYAGDPFWTPPLIRSRLKTLDPARGTFFRQGEAACFIARRGRRDLGTIVAWINQRSNRYRDEKVAGFGFFEVVDDYQVAESLLAAACDWARARGMTLIRGPLYFSTEDSPGALVEGQEWPPVLLMGHTPLYYAGFLERFGMRKYRDAFGFRLDLSELQGDVHNLNPKLLRADDIMQRRYGFTVRPMRMADWDDELAAVISIFNEALGYQREHVPMDEREFISYANELKRLIDPDLVLVAEVDGQPIGISVTLPDVNQVLRRLNGRLFPWGWLKLLWYRQRIDVASFKILGVLESYRGKGIEATFSVETARQLIAKRYAWVDFSLVAEENDAAIRLAEHMGLKRYKTYRTYEMTL
jgi:GNAT superfamily N-acetyltransferase